MLLFYTTQRIVSVLFFPNIFNHTSLNGPVASGASVDPNSHVCSPAMLVLPTVVNCKVWFCNSPQAHSHTKCVQNLSGCCRVESWGRTDTDRHDLRFNPEDGGSTLLRKVDFTNQFTRRLNPKEHLNILRNGHAFISCTSCNERAKIKGVNRVAFVVIQGIHRSEFVAL
jgi:hypothetical protein